MNSIRKQVQVFLRSFLDFLVENWAHDALEERAEKIVRLFESSIPAGSRVLDVGGGWGFYDKPLRDRGHQPLVLDVIKPGYHRAPVLIYDGKRIPFPDQSFDVTLLVTVLHHVADPAALLGEVWRVTRSRVVVVEDLYRHFWGRFWTICRDRLLNLELLGHPHQFRKKEEWTVFFESHGFRQVFFTEFRTWLAGLRILNGLYVFERT
ncbi:MAG: class I SAM-dependent methyltransferase [Candidatus Omnitrophica bacterium]|nr:class I SAM-dependent methyltransferase [Candidatus Omnitrophota bacterium]